jgi:RNA-dependent RNA polymerase
MVFVGDYDGDTILAIWHLVMVLHFQNADEKYSKDPQGLEHAFTRDTETGATFLEKTAKMDSITKIQAMQTYLLGALSDPSLIGNYSVMHNNAIYKYGYGHPRTHKIAAK